jgi:phosphatidylglycerophosphatase A
LTRLKNAVAFTIATWFGCGYFPWGPGTVGSLAALGIAWLMHDRLGAAPSDFGEMAGLITLPAMWAAEIAARVSQKKDPQFVVVDEVAGQWLALGGAWRLNWVTWIAAFVLFRLFDIWKPPPVRQLEKLRGGVGIVADDLMAGLYAAIVLYVTGWLKLY